MKKNKKKLLVVSNMYPSKKYPHYGVFVEHTVEVLRLSGYIIDVVSMHKMDGKIRKLFVYFGFYWSVVWKGLFGKYDAVYAHYASHTALPLLILHKIKKLPIIMNVHGNDVVPETEVDEKYTGLVAKILAESDFVIAPSEYFKKEVINRFNVSEECIGVYPSGGVDTNKFCRIKRSVAATYLNLPTRNRYIGYVSRIEEKKGWDIFLKACSNIVKDNGDIRLIVVGDGAQTEQFIELVDELNIGNVIIKYDLLPQKEIVYIFNVLDVFAFSTYRKSESLGLVGLEAMACETITVLPDNYGPAGYGKDGVNSFVFETGDVESLEKTIRRALDNKDMTIKAKARETALLYNHDSSDNIILNLMREII